MKQRIRIAFYKTATKATPFVVSRPVCRMIEDMVGAKPELLAFSEEDGDKVMLYEVHSEKPVDLMVLEKYLTDDLKLPNVRVTRADTP